MKYLLLLVFFFATPALAYAPIGYVEEVPQQAAPETCDDSQIRCNCYLFVKSLIPDLPRTVIIHANIVRWPPQIGSVAVFTYSGGLRHYAYVIALNGYTFRVKECNFKSGVCGERDVSYDDPHLDGFWPGK